MIDTSKRYADTRPSGEQWLGDIPAHWNCKPHRALFQEVIDQGHIDEPLLSVTISRGVIPQAELLAKSSKKDSSNLDKSKYKLLREGDIAYNKMRAWQGAAGVSRQRGIVSPAYVVQRLRGKELPEYYHHLFRTPIFAKEAERWSYGITSDMWSLRPEHFKMIYSPVPPVEEQAAIVRFLAEADRRISRLIRAKRRMIELLEEQKQAIITRAVTRGLDPGVEMKESGIAWHGKVPSHWELTRLGRVVDLLPGFAFKSEGFSTNANDVRLMRGINISPGTVRWESTVYWPEIQLEQYVRYMLMPSDVVIGMDRPFVKGGVRVASISERDVPSLLVQRVSRLRGSVLIDGEYIHQLLACRHFVNYLTPEFTGISVPHISPQQIKNYSIALPPIEEQRDILHSINHRAREIDTALDRSKQEIEFIRECRTRLIADVVTGKLDVREAASQLPEAGEGDEEAAFDEDDADAAFDGVEDEMAEEIEA